MVHIGRCEQIICNIAANVSRIIDPVGLGLEVAVLGDGLLGDLTSRVDVALDVVLATLPLPVGVPLGASRADTVDISALRARGGGAAAPDVVVELVAVAGKVLEVLAESGLLCNSHGGESTKDERYDLHDGRVVEDWLVEREYVAVDAIFTVGCPTFCIDAIAASITRSCIAYPLYDFRRWGIFEWVLIYSSVRSGAKRP